MCIALSTARRISRVKTGASLLQVVPPAIKGVLRFILCVSLCCKVLEHAPEDQECLSKFMASSIQARIPLPNLQRIFCIIQRHVPRLAITPPPSSPQAQSARDARAISGPSKQESLASEAKVTRCGVRAFRYGFCALFVIFVTVCGAVRRSQSRGHRRAAPAILERCERAVSCC
jgi:hypothetical protein